MFCPIPGGEHPGPSRLERGSCVAREGRPAHTEVLLVLLIISRPRMSYKEKRHQNDLAEVLGGEVCR